jgi:hypothetical protein
VSQPGTLAWFARHEFRLAWRDGLSMMTADGRTRLRTVALVFVVFIVIMHLIAYGMVSRYAGLALHPDKTALVVITGSVLLSLSAALVACFGIAAAAASATAIQLLFRAQAKRSQFRRRQTSSRIATFAEAFSSIAWTGAAALAAAGAWISLVPALIAVAILGAARLVRPKEAYA